LEIKAIIFDVSGTLIDPSSSERAHKTILAKILGDYEKKSTTKYATKHWEKL